MDNRQNSTINWYPGHMEKTKREIKKIISLIDFILELIDARIPFSSKVKGIEDITKGKPKILVLMKSDLCDKVETAKWVKMYEENNDEVILIDINNKEDIKNLNTKIQIITDEINKKRALKGLKPKEAKGLVIGIPNVGKSSLINKLAKRKALGVANIPGYTKNLTWLKAGNALLLDSPGILWPKFDNETVALNLASMSAIKSEILPIENVASYILKMLDTYYKDILKEKFGIEKLSEDLQETYDFIGKRIGTLAKEGKIDYNKVWMFVINAIKSESIKGITFDRY